MADETKTLAWRLIIETQNIDKNTRQAANSLANLEGAAGKLQKGLKGLGLVAAAAAAAQLALEGLRMVDAYTQLANTLKQSTDSAAELQAVQLKLIEQANATTSTVTQTVASFNKLHDATEGLGLSQQQVIDLSKTLADTMRLSGMNAEQAQAGIETFANTLEDGSMNLKEFKQAFKESPELIKALQAGLGKTKDELRLMAEQGTLTTEVMLEGLAKAADEVAKRVGAMTPTVTDAFKSAASNWAAMMGEFNEGAGVTAGLANMVKSAGDAFTWLGERAQLFGITVKMAFQTVVVELQTFAQMAFELLLRAGVSFNRALNDIMTGAGIFGEGFSKAIDEQQAASDARMAAILDKRKKNLVEIRKMADEAAEALNGANLNQPGAKSERGPTDEEIKNIANFDKALDAMKKRARDATAEMAALRVEMSQGKQAADAFRAQMAAAAAGDELRKQLESGLKKGQSLSKQQLKDIADGVAEVASKTAQLKNSQDAWSLYSHAVNAAMTESERAAQEIDALTAAFESLHQKIPATTKEMEDFERAKAKIAERGAALETSMDDAILALKAQAQTAKQEFQLLRVEILQGADAAQDYKAKLSRAKIEESFIAQFTKELEKAHKEMTPERIADVKALAASITETEMASMSAADALAVYRAALGELQSPADIAAAKIRMINEAMIALDRRGLLTDEMIANFDKSIEHISDGFDLMKRGGQQAVAAIMDNFVDFLADGEFNMKRFVDSTIKDLARIAIKMLLISAFRGTKVGDLMGWSEGGAFHHGRVVPMAQGGIVSKPTIFPMAGGAGLMGEAGPEAVMPLARLSSGKLGVGAQPGNIQVVNNTGVEARARIERSENRTQIILEAATLGAQLAEDRITRSMRSGYGATSTALQGTYGLRRRG